MTKATKTKTSRVTRLKSACTRINNRLSIRKSVLFQRNKLMEIEKTRQNQAGYLNSGIDRSSRHHSSKTENNWVKERLRKPREMVARIIRANSIREGDLKVKLSILASNMLTKVILSTRSKMRLLIKRGILRLLILMT